MPRSQQNRGVRPGRLLATLLVLLIVLYGVMALTKTWKPQLGLDLRGGLSVTLTAKQATGGGNVTAEELAEAQTIIQQRVDGAGVGESSVETQGNNHIVVAVPGANNDGLVERIGQTALLRFRIVYAAAQSAQPPTVNSSGTPQPSSSPSIKASSAPTANGTPARGAQGSGPRPVPGAAATPSATANPSANPTANPTMTPQSKNTTAPSAKASSAPSLTQNPLLPQASSQPSAQPTAQPSGPLPTTKVTGNPLSWQPDQAWQAYFSGYNCPAPNQKKNPAADSSTQPLVSCDGAGNKYLLGPPIIEGTDLSDSYAGIPPNQVAWQVNLEFKSEGAQKFLNATTFLSKRGEGQNQFAIVLDGDIVSAPTVAQPIPGGRAEISGSFTQDTAQQLANQLKYGALPLAFDTSEAQTVSPELGASSLRAGILAGLIGLAIVMIYAFFYYRLLAITVVISLVVAAALTFASVVLLGKAMGFALSLAGIAGLIVAIGITADSFVVYFERLRDEIREGRSLRSAVESGWIRARRTILAADSISLLSAVVLYVLAIGSVRGFAFTLGLTTLIDLIVVFLFTKPMVSLLIRTRFFGGGHRLSGLSPQSVGVKKIVGARGSGRGRTGTARPARAGGAGGTRAPRRDDPGRSDRTGRSS